MSKKAVALACLAVLVAIVVLSLADWNLHGDVWQHNPAAKKLAVVWNYCLEDQTPASWPSAARLLILFAEVMNLTFSNVGDDFPINSYNVFYFNFTLNARREKLIHSQGPIAPVTWVDEGGHNFTGLFKGASNGLIRFSLAQKPSNGYIPGISLKFFRDYTHSANIMAMYKLTGQESFNFFEHDFSNHPPELPPDAGFFQKKLRNVFAEASIWPTFLGLSDLASIQENGVPEANISFPYRLVFHPTQKYHEMFPNTTSETLVEQLSSSLAANSIVYYIYAQFTPFSNNVTRIGHLVLQTAPIGSDFGDSSLFFQHQRMDDDLDYMPEWVEPTAELQQEQSNTNGWSFPDLPFDE